MPKSPHKGQQVVGNTYAAAPALTPKSSVMSVPIAPASPSMVFTTAAQHVFPHAWGPPPQALSQDSVVLPGGYGRGSSTVAKWIKARMETDRSNGIVSFPPLFGEAPSVETNDFVSWPFGYGDGSSTIRLWLIDRAFAVYGVHTHTEVKDSYSVDVPIVEEDVPKRVKPPPSPAQNGIYEREYQKTLNYQPEVEVPVVTHTYTQAINHVPKIIERLVNEDVDVRHITIKETPDITERWEREEVIKKVPRTVVREEVVTQVVSGPPQREEYDVDVEIPVGPTKYQLVTPVIVGDGAAVTYTPITGDSVDLGDNVVEIQCEVDVPQVNLLETTEVQERKIPIEVVHTHRVETAMETVQEVVEQKIVQVPHNTIERVIRENPVLVHYGGRDLLQDGFREARPVDAAFRAELNALLQEQRDLEAKRARLSAALAQEVTEVNTLKQSILVISRNTVVVEAQLRSSDEVHKALGSPVRGGSAGGQSSPEVIKVGSPQVTSTVYAGEVRAATDEVAEGQNVSKTTSIRSTQKNVVGSGLIGGTRTMLGSK